MFKDATNMVREYIYRHSEEYLCIIKKPSYAQQFAAKGTALKHVPKEYPADCAAAEYLKYKSWYIEYPVDDTLLQNLPAFVEFASEIFLKMKPFNDFLNQTLTGFPMPAR